MEKRISPTWTLKYLTKELEKDLGDLSSDPLYGAINHEAMEDIDGGVDGEGGGCDCCDYYAYSDGDTPEGDL